MGQTERTISFAHDGRTYNLTARDFTGEDEFEVWRAAGVSIGHIFAGDLSQAPMLVVLSALLWRYRVNDGEDDLTFRQVLRSMNYDAVETVSPEPQDGGDPKASDGV